MIYTNYFFTNFIKKIVTIHYYYNVSSIIEKRTELLQALGFTFSLRVNVFCLRLRSFQNDQLL